MKLFVWEALPDYQLQIYITGRFPGEILAHGRSGSVRVSDLYGTRECMDSGRGNCNWHPFPFYKQSYRGEVRVWRQSGNSHPWYLYGDMETSVGIIRCLYAFDHWCSARTEQQENVQKMYTFHFFLF